MGFQVVPQAAYDAGYENMGLMVLAPGAFIILGLAIWAQRTWNGYAEENVPVATRLRELRYADPVAPVPLPDFSKPAPKPVAKPPPPKPAFQRKAVQKEFKIAKYSNAADAARAIRERRR